MACFCFCSNSTFHSVSETVSWGNAATFIPHSFPDSYVNWCQLVNTSHTFTFKVLFAPPHFTHILLWRHPWYVYAGTPLWRPFVLTWPLWPVNWMLGKTVRQCWLTVCVGHASGHWLIHFQTQCVYVCVCEREDICRYSTALAGVLIFTTLWDDASEGASRVHFPSLTTLFRAQLPL